MVFVNVINVHSRFSVRFVAYYQRGAFSGDLICHNDDNRKFHKVSFLYSNKETFTVDLNYAMS